MAMMGGTGPAVRTEPAEGSLTTQQVRQMIEESRTSTVQELRELVKQDWEASGTAKKDGHILPQILTAHTFSGCATVANMFGLGKATIMIESDSEST